MRLTKIRKSLAWYLLQFNTRLIYPASPNIKFIIQHIRWSIKIRPMILLPKKFQVDLSQCCTVSSPQQITNSHAYFKGFRVAKINGQFFIEYL